MDDLLIEIKLNNFTPSDIGKSWCAEITGMYDEDRPSFTYLKNGFDVTSTYRLREGHVYKLHQPLGAKQVREFWFVVENGKCRKVSEDWMMRFALSVRADKEALIWGNCHAEDSVTEVLDYE